MSPITPRDVLFSVVVAIGLLAATSLRAQGPAVELEGYFAQAAVLASERAAPTAPNVQATDQARAQTIDAAGLLASPQRDDANDSLIAHLSAAYPRSIRR
jgi:hypothetical protein